MLKKNERFADGQAASLGRIIEDSMNEIYIFHSQTLKFEMVNRGARENLGYTMDEMQELTPVAIKPYVTEEEFQELCQPLLSGEMDHQIFSTIHERKDGTRYEVEVRMSYSTYEGHAVYFAIIQDVTDRKKAEEELYLAVKAANDANHAKSQFLATMSHEFRTPLNAILGFSEFMTMQSKRPLTMEKCKEYAADIYNSATHLHALVKDLLDMSTIEVSKQTLSKERISIAEVFSESIKLVEGQASSSGIEISLAIAKDIPALHADKRAIKQILINLLNNAIKFTQPGGQITLSTTASKSHITIKVKDTGHGIAANKIAAMRQAFIKGEDNAHKATEGWGLGLAICDSLIGLHDGEMSIESEINSGTIISVVLPIGA